MKEGGLSRIAFYEELRKRGFSADADRFDDLTGAQVMIQGEINALPFVMSVTMPISPYADHRPLLSNVYSEAAALCARHIPGLSGRA